MNKHAAALALVLIYAAAFRLSVLNRPFDYDAEGSGCLNGVLARSYLRFGWAAGHGMPILSNDPDLGAPIVFYPDHPPLVPLLIVPVYAAFGVGAWQTRLPVSILTIAAIFVLYRMVAARAGERAAILAAAIFAATPMTLYFGGFPDVVGTPLVLFVLLTVSTYLRFHDNPQPDTFWPFVGAFVLAGVCDWPAYVLVPVLTLHFLTTRHRGDWRWIFGFLLAACLLFAAVYTYITFATHSAWTWMIPKFTRRSGLAGGSRVWSLEWLAAAFAANRTYHTLPLLVVSGAWVAVCGFRLRKSIPGAAIARLLLAWAAVYAFIGSKALFNHEWAWIPFTPGLAVAAALALDAGLETAERRGRARLAGYSIGVLLVSCAAWTAYSTFGSLYPSTPGQAFTPMDMGEAIQAAAPDRNEVAMVAGDDEAEAQLWFYGDRLLRTGIRSVQDFERRVHDGTVDLAYYFDEQPWSARASGIVFPRVWEHDLGVLHAYLKARYPVKPLPPALGRKFEVFDLRATR
jgi:hypothetical protein